MPLGLNFNNTNNSSVYSNLLAWTKLEYPESTASTLTREVLFEKYKPKPIWDSFELPIAKQIAATTVAMDLVSVLPLAAPSATLFYLDYNYEHENVFNRKVLVEKYKDPLKRT